MKKIILISLQVIFIASTPLYSQENQLYRYNTIQLEQKWKKHLTGEKDTSYIKICIPNNDVKPMKDLNYDGFVIICDDGAIIRFNSIPIVPITIEHYLESFYEDTVSKCFGNGFLCALQREYVKTAILGSLHDSSLYSPQSITLEGISEKGLFWKLKRIGYVSISYENVIPTKKYFYDFILNEYKILKKNEVFTYRYLSLYK
ncbi:MAG: hypothetical protein IJK36_09515 [Bacteroidales bacterium]|nr:hypothetical protein [Bacteroidales bacterium]MBR0540441.1 hypothetical protein [Bacteroidales bacterium]